MYLLEQLMYTSITILTINDFITMLHMANDFVCIIRIYLYWKNLFYKLCLTEVAPSMLKVKHGCVIVIMTVASWNIWSMYSEWKSDIVALYVHFPSVAIFSKADSYRWRWGASINNTIQPPEINIGLFVYNLFLLLKHTLKFAQYARVVQTTWDMRVLDRWRGDNRIWKYVQEKDSSRTIM